MEIKRVKHYMTIKQSPTASPFSPCRPWSPEGPCNPFSPICPGLSEKGNVSVHSASWNQLKSPNYEQDNSKPSLHGVLTCPARPKFNFNQNFETISVFFQILWVASVAAWVPAKTLEIRLFHFQDDQSGWPFWLLVSPVPGVFSFWAPPWPKADLTVMGPTCKL